MSSVPVLKGMVQTWGKQSTFTNIPLSTKELTSIWTFGGYCELILEREGQKSGFLCPESSDSELYIEGQKGQTQLFPVDNHLSLASLPNTPSSLSLQAHHT